MPDKTDRYFESQRRDMLSFVPQAARRILDVGCGAGGFLASLAEARRDSSLDLWGLEPDADAARRARSRGLRVVTGGYPESLPEDATGFDCIVFNDVLEHLVDPWSAVRDAVQRLRVGGAVVASIPNVRNYATLYHLLVKGEWRYVSQGVLDSTHLRFFTRSTAIEMFTDAGLRVERIEGHWPLTTPKMRALHGAVRLMSAKAADELRYRQWAVRAVWEGLR